jgi:hypothetical protein
MKYLWIKAKIRKAAYVRCRLLISIGHCSEASGDKISGCKKAKQVNSGHLLATVATTINKIIAVKIPVYITRRCLQNVPGVCFRIAAALYYVRAGSAPNLCIAPKPLPIVV